MNGDKYILWQRSDGSWGLDGIDLSTNRGVLVMETPKQLMGHLPGRTYFGGIGMRHYAPPTLYVFNKLGKWEKSGSYSRSIHVEQIAEIDMPKGWLKNTVPFDGVWEQKR